MPAETSTRTASPRTVRFLRTDSSAWTTAATGLTEAEADDLADALQQLPHILGLTVTRDQATR